MNEKQFCKCGDEGIYLAGDTITTICKGRDGWFLESEILDYEFRCDHCDELMPEEIDNKIFNQSKNMKNE